MRIYVRPLLPPLVLALGWASAGLSWDSDPYPADAAADGDAVLAETTALVEDVGPRPGGSEAAAQATAWVEARLAAEGLPFETVDGTYDDARKAWERIEVPRIVNPTLPGDDPLRNRLVHFPLDGQPAPTLAGRILVMGHTDSVRVAPGAEDNASGVALCLDLCRYLKQHPPKRKVTVAFTDGEEDWLLGAAIIADRMTTAELDELSLAFAVEMSGWNERPYLHWFLNTSMLRGIAPPPDGVLAGILGSGTEHGSFGQVDPYVGWLFPALREHLSIGRDADHRPFELRGRPAVMMTTSSLAQFYPYYHTRDDTPDKLSAGTLGRSASALRSAVHALGSAPDIGVDSGTYGYPILGNVIASFWMRLALFAAAAMLALTRRRSGYIAAAGFVLLTIATPPSQLGVGVAIPAAVFMLYAHTVRAVWLHGLLKFLGMLPFLIALGAYLFAKHVFGDQTELHLYVVETLGLVVALLGCLALTRPPKPVEPAEAEHSVVPAATQANLAKH